MRYAILSDIHANAAALRAVLADAQDMRAERVVCLGDVLGYGPEPVAALETVYARAHVCLAGNHDDAVCGRCSTEDFNDIAAKAVKRQRGMLTDSARAWLERLPYVCEMDGFACAHGDFSDPQAFNYILEPEEAMPSWEVRGEQLLFVGHTHRPGIFVIGGSGTPHRLEPADFVLEDGKRYIVNVGSVGYPRSGLCRSFYCIYDDRSRTVFFRSLPFDLEGYREKMGGEGFDEAPWVTARANERAVPCVRNGADFGRRPPPSASPAPSVRRRRLPALVAVPVVIAAAVAAAVWFARKGVPPAPPPAVPAPMKEAMLPVPLAPPAPVAEMLKTQMLKLPPDTRKVYYNIQLGKGSAPVRAHVVFRGADGRVIPGDEDWFTVKKGRKRSTRRFGMAVPPGAVYAALEIGKVQAHDVCAVSHAYFSLKEEEQAQ